MKRFWIELNDDKNKKQRNESITEAKDARRKRGLTTDQTIGTSPNQKKKLEQNEMNRRQRKNKI